MTKVIVDLNNDLITKITIKDHAGFNDYGQDIVCASISTITFGILNSLSQYGLSDDMIEISDAYITIDFNNNDNLQLIGQVMLIQYETVAQGYPQHLKLIYQ
ncbi:MAG: ribosomal-processing cysteine protease Prp [Bacilli bacterium]